MHWELMTDLANAVFYLASEAGHSKIPIDLSRSVESLILYYTLGKASNYGGILPIRPFLLLRLHDILAVELGGRAGGMWCGKGMP